MVLPKGIKKLPLAQWTNRHENFTVELTEGASFDMEPPLENLNDQAGNYHATTKNFQWLIKNAIEQEMPLRAMGSGWSFTDVAVSRGGIVDTKEIRTFFKVKKSYLHEDYLRENNPEGIVFTQCGMSIYQLNKELEQENGWNRCLKASGASDGQTIAGAISTGTHGSAFRFGAVHDAVIGLHLITGPDSHVWLERGSRRVASDAFVSWLGAERISDDDAFHSALVSFGSFGFINGVLLETDNKFLLKRYTTGMIPFDANIEKAVNELDFTGIMHHFPAQPPENELYHFEVIVNPHSFSNNNPEQGVYMKAMFKAPYRPDYNPPQQTPGYEYGDDLLAIMQKVLDNAGPVIREHLIPRLVSSLLPLAYVADEETEGTMGEIFTNTKIRGRAASAAIGIDAAYASRAISEIVGVNRSQPFAGALALRFVKGTKATLGFTKFPKTCVLEMDGVDSEGSRAFFMQIWERFEELGIPYTVHWGKINFHLNKDRVIRMYGQDKVNTWLKWRGKLLTPEVRQVFSNDFMERCGLNV